MKKGKYLQMKKQTLLLLRLGQKKMESISFQIQMKMYLKKLSFQKYYKNTSGFNKGTLIKLPIIKYFEKNKSNDIIQRSKEEIKIPILQFNKEISIKESISPNIYFSEFFQNKYDSIYKI